MLVLIVGTACTFAQLKVRSGLLKTTETDTIIYSESFIDDLGTYIILDYKLGGLSQVWSRQSPDYCMAAYGYKTSAQETESWLVTPTISLEDYGSAKLTFEHLVYNGSPNNLKVKISTDSGWTWEDLTISQWPSGTSWTFENVEVSLNAYARQSIRIAFCYVSTTSNCPLWEVKNLQVSAGDYSVKIGNYYYKLDSDNQTAEVCYELFNSTNNYSSLSSCYIPNSVTYNGKIYIVNSIGWAAFYKCPNITSVSIPKNISSIGEFAFTACNSLSSVTWNAQNCPTYIDSEGYIYPPFYNVREQITSFTLGYQVQRIPDYLFMKMNALESISIPDGVTHIGVGAFYGCSGLTSLEIPQSVNSIGESAFEGCTQISTLDIPEGVTEIKAFTFLNCTSLWSIYLPSSITSIEKGAFAYTKLASITISENTDMLGDSLFYGCSSLYAVNDNATTPQNATRTFAGLNLSEITLQVPGGYDEIYANAPVWRNFGTIKGSYVEIGDLLYTLNTLQLTANVFEHGDNYSGEKVIPSTVTYLNKTYNVTSIGYYAFHNCSDLTSITIPSSVTKIGDKAFADCPNLKAVIDYAYTPQELEDNVFDVKTAMLYVYNKAYDSYFDNSTWYKYFSKDYIRPIAFMVNGMNYAPDPDEHTVEVVKLYDEHGEYSGDITIPAEVTYEGEIYPVTAIGNFAFEHTHITSVAIPEGITRIGIDAFESCGNLTSVTIPNSVTVIDYCAFIICQNLNSLTLGNSVREIGIGAFMNCYSLTNVVLPNSVTVLGHEAFAGCKFLETITFGTSLKEIGLGCFEGCPRIMDIYSFATSVPEVGYDPNDDAFGTVDKSQVYLWIPASRQRNYERDAYWSQFNIQIMSADSVEDVSGYSVSVRAGETTAAITWPQVESADIYDMTIKDKQGTVICSFEFNGQGQLNAVSYVPARNQEVHQASGAGYRFTVTNLSKGTEYDLTIKASDAGGNALKSYFKSFTTLGGEESLELVTPEQSGTKLIRDGHIFILRGDKIFTIQGQLVQ